MNALVDALRERATMAIAERVMTILMLALAATLVVVGVGIVAFSARGRLTKATARRRAFARRPLMSHVQRTRLTYAAMRGLLILGGVLMFTGGVMGASPDHSRPGSLGGGGGWSDPAYIFAMTGLVSVVLAFLSPIYKNYFDQQKLLAQNAEMFRQFSDLSRQHATLGSKLDSLDAKINRFADENRRLTTDVMDASHKNGDKIDRLQQQAEARPGSNTDVVVNVESRE